MLDTRLSLTQFFAQEDTSSAHQRALTEAHIGVQTSRPASQGALRPGGRDAADHAATKAVTAPATAEVAAAPEGSASAQAAPMEETPSAADA